MLGALLLAHNVTPDPTTSVKAFRKFSAFAGPTFSVHLWGADSVSMTPPIDRSHCYMQAIEGGQ